jgi:hypothetical protein
MSWRICWRNRELGADEFLRMEPHGSRRAAILAFPASRVATPSRLRFDARRAATFTNVPAARVIFHACANSGTASLVWLVAENTPGADSMAVFDCD